MSDEAIEREIQSKGLTATRITPADIEATIKSEEFVVFGTLTICVLGLRNGFQVTGESACVNPANFNAEIGQKLARQKAVDKIWALEGYLLAERLLPRPGAHHSTTEPDDARDAVRWRHAILEMCHSFDGQDRTYYLRALGRESFAALIDRRIALTKESAQ